MYKRNGVYVPLTLQVAESIAYAFAQIPQGSVHSHEGWRRRVTIPGGALVFGGGGARRS